MKNSVISLTIFFVIGLGVPVSALIKQNKKPGPRTGRLNHYFDASIYSIPDRFLQTRWRRHVWRRSKTLWSKVHPADENNLCTWAMRCLLIEEGGKLILVDNGIGDKQDARFFSHYHLHGDDSLDRSLAANGFHRDDITDVLLTHLHFDHCGGSIIREGDKLVPAFKNATYWSHSRHWKWATEPNDREKASFLKRKYPADRSERTAAICGYDCRGKDSHGWLRRGIGGFT
jgi:hypothetical protein